MPTHKFKKRKRISRPTPLILTGFLFLSLPFLNSFIISTQLGIDYFSPIKLISALQVFQILLLVFPFLVGIGLLSVEKWGYFTFLLYSGTLIIYNIVIFIWNPVVYNLGALFQSILGTIAILYFIRKDISAPYMKMYPRGWRLEKRKPYILDVSISEKILTTRDVSLSGIYVSWQDCPYQLNDEIFVSFQIKNETFRLNAGIVRIEDSGVGIAFRGMSLETENRLAICLATN